MPKVSGCVIGKAGFNGDFRLQKVDLLFCLASARPPWFSEGFLSVGTAVLTNRKWPPEGILPDGLRALNMEFRQPWDLPECLPVCFKVAFSPLRLVKWVCLCKPGRGVLLPIPNLELEKS